MANRDSGTKFSVEDTFKPLDTSLSNTSKSLHVMSCRTKKDDWVTKWIILILNPLPLVRNENSQDPSMKT